MSNSTVVFSPSTLPNLEDAKKVGSLDPRLSRTDYFDGRLLTATDLIRDQTYVDERVLEVGRALGSGVVRGLAVELSDDKRYLRINPGLAITESGRVLEVTSEKPLEIDLYDRALLINLNSGRYRRFKRGLYAVTIQYAELGSDSAESYPADPTEKNEFQYDSFVEGSEVTLTPLSYPLPSDNELVSRASLAQHFLRNPGQPHEVSDQAISLGILAMNNDRPQWLDTHLLRRPMRPEHITAAWQLDINRHYLELLDTVMQQRTSRSQDGEFSAKQYFHLLPPAGVLPMASVDPSKSAQYYFPENYEVSISPVRYEDLSVIQSESMQLAPLNLDKGEAAEIIILAPMSNLDFMDNARRLGFSPEEEVIAKEGEVIPNYWLHATDLLQLRLAADSTAPTDNATKVWNDIWALIGKGNGMLHYVRRPARAAETQVSAVVLAHGFKIPDPDNSIEDQLVAIKVERDEAIENLANAGEDLQECKTELARAIQDLADAGSSGDEQSEKIAELEATISGLTNQVSTLTSQIDGFKLAAENAIEKLADCQVKLQECQNSQNNTDTGIITCLRDPICRKGILKYRGLKDPVLFDRANEILSKTAEMSPENSKIIWEILGDIPPTHDKLIWPTLEVAVNEGKLDPLRDIVAGSADLSQIEKKISEDTTLNLPVEVVEGWAGKGDLAVNVLLDGGGTAGTVSGLGDLQTVLDLRGTRDTTVRTEAASAIDVIKTSPKDMKSAENIIKNVSGSFDSVLWLSIEMASKTGSLQELETIMLNNADDPKLLAKSVVENSAVLGIDAGTADRWTSLAGGF
ncbi:MAG: hypothetical protein DRQ44_00130 [Gammaproteobacteria bacterium]|nr:MAG: hypothetical protein DRQ44_00130 [Gammaproteobacteria bacterium]